MEPANLLVVMSDEHSRRVLGSYGHAMIKTPHLDRLAAQGVRFTDAYCNSPICVPSRASFATGRHVHRIRFWDNAIPYDGSIPSWGHRLQEAGHRSVSIGKLHFRSADDRNGFDDEIMPLHVVDGIGDLLGLLRDDLPVRKAALRLAEEAGRGDSNYQQYDGRITDAAVDWLTARSTERAGKPWVLFVSLVCPHFPLIARPEWYDLYPEDAVLLLDDRSPRTRKQDVVDAFIVGVLVEAVRVIGVHGHHTSVGPLRPLGTEGDWLPAIPNISYLSARRLLVTEKTPGTLFAAI